MASQQKQLNAAYGYLNRATSLNKFEFFILIPLEEGKTALFGPEKYIAGLTLLNIEIVEDKENEEVEYAFKHITLNPLDVDSNFDPEHSFIRVVVSIGSEVTVSEFRYKDAGTGVLETEDIKSGVYYNTPYVHMAEWKNEEGKIMLGPKVLIPVDGFKPSHAELVAESVEENMYKSVVVLTPDETTETGVKILESVNELEYLANEVSEGHYTAVALKAQGNEEAEFLLTSAILDDLDEVQETKTRKGRVRKRRTATRGQGDQNDNGDKKADKKDTKTVPARKGKVRKKYTRTRDLEPVTKPEEE